MQAAGDVWVRHSAFGHPKPSHPEFVRGLAFGCALEVIAPSPATAAAAVEGAWAGMGASHFYAVEASLGDLAKPEFIQRHLKSGGEFCAMACCMPGDRRGAVAVTPDGHLHLSVAREDYQRLGLVGAAGGGGGGEPKEWYKVDIKLTAESFKPKERFYERVMECVEKTAPMKLLCSFAKGGAADAVHLPGAEPGGRRELRYARRVVEGAAPPPLPAGAGEEVDPECAEALLEWVGALSCGAHGRTAGGGTPRGGAGAMSEAGGEPGPYWWAEEAQHGAGRAAGEVEVHRWEGLVAAWHVERALALARGRVEGGGSPWAVVTWAGAADVPDGARGPRGARDACILLLGGGEYLLFAVG